MRRPCQFYVRVIEGIVSVPSMPATTIAISLSKCANGEHVSMKCVKGSKRCQLGSDHSKRLTCKVITASEEWLLELFFEAKKSV